MQSELLVRGLIGGAIVSAFAAVADIVKPKSFAGLFGAAPSVALATLALTIGREGPAYAAIEGRSMMAGAVAFGLYAYLVCLALVRSERSIIVVTGIALFAWMAMAFGLWAVWLDENHP
jgi:hypothetical protein